MIVAIIGLCLGAGGAYFISRYAQLLGLVDVPNGRSSHCQPTPRGGGVGLLLALFFVVHRTSLPVHLWGPAAALALLSLYDDVFGLSARIKLICQFIAATLLVAGILFSPLAPDSLILFPICLLFVVGTTNFYNFMDGINGIAGLSGVVAFGMLAIFIGLNLPESRYFLVTIAIMAASAGFLPFNLPNAKVFMGDIGSVLLGFLFSAMVVSLSRDLADFLCLSSFLFLFYADGLSTLYIRWRDGEQLTRAHRRHLYQVLCNELGLAHWQISSGYALLQCFVAALMLIFYTQGPLWQIGWLLFCALIFLISGQKIRDYAAQRQ